MRLSLPAVIYEASAPESGRPSSHSRCARNAVLSHPSSSSAITLSTLHAQHPTALPIPHTVPSPLHHLIAVLLSHFKAHYTVRVYEADAALKPKARTRLHLAPKRPRAASLSIVCIRTSAGPTPTARNDADNHRDSFESEEENLMWAALQMFGSDDVMNIDERSPELQEPPGEEKERVARLGTPQYVKELLFGYIVGRVLWPKEDHVGDQLEGQEERTNSKRLGSEGGVTTTTIAIAEDEESVYAVWKRLLTLTVCADLSPLVHQLFCTCQRVASAVPNQRTS